MANTTSIRAVPQPEENKPGPGVCNRCRGPVEPYCTGMRGHRFWVVDDICDACRAAVEAERKEQKALDKKRREYERRLEASNLPPESEGWDFDRAEELAMERLQGSDLRAWRQAATYCRTWPPSSRKGLYITGKTGRGKTVLAYCILHAALAEGITVLFVSVSELFSDTKLGFQKDTSAKDLVHRAGGVRVLVLDELGAEKLRPWMQQIILDLLDHRIKHRLPTIITTNCSLKEMEALIGDPHKRVMSRLMGNFAGVEVGGSDFRCLDAASFWVV